METHFAHENISHAHVVGQLEPLTEWTLTELERCTDLDSVRSAYASTDCCESSWA